MLTEFDWVGFCRTVHGMLCLAVSGEGKEDYGSGGDAILQAFLTLQRVFAHHPVSTTAMLWLFVMLAKGCSTGAGGDHKVDSLSRLDPGGRRVSCPSLDDVLWGKDLWLGALRSQPQDESN